jgi:hypothetical protein
VSDAVNREFANLKLMHADAVLLKEGGQSVALLPGFGFTAGDKPFKMDLLLVPFAHSGYVTRLFFERQIQGRGAACDKCRPLEKFSADRPCRAAPVRRLAAYRPRTRPARCWSAKIRETYLIANGLMALVDALVANHVDMAATSLNIKRPKDGILPNVKRIRMLPAELSAG